MDTSIIEHLSDIRIYLWELDEEDPTFFHRFVKATGIDRQVLYDVSKGNTRFDYDLCRKLSEFMGQSEGFWIRMLDSCDGYKGVLDCIRSNGAIVFLDIDGVLNTYSYSMEERQDDLYVRQGCWSVLVNRFNALCRSIRASIVLSSTWRHLCDNLEEANAMLAGIGIEANCIGMTDSEHPDTRSEVIEKWIKRKMAADCNVVVLDDESLTFSDDFRNLVYVHVDNLKGLTADDCNRVIGFLDEINREKNFHEMP